MGLAIANSIDLEEQLQEYIKLPYHVSIFLQSQERDTHVFEEFFKEESSELMMRFQPGPTAEGPPGHCHGGFIATFLDECMGGVAWWSTYVVLAGKLNIKYRKPVPLNQTYYAKAEILRVEKRRVYCRSQLLTRNGVLLAQGDGIFIRLPWDKFPEDKHDHFEVTRRFIEIRHSGKPFQECLLQLQEEQRKMTPFA